MFFRWRRALPLLLLMLGSFGCIPVAEGPQDEQRNPYIVTGRERFKARDYKGAIAAYEKALEVNPHSVTAHFELGVIYEQYEIDYPAAIYHYNQVLRLRPDGAYPADNARQRIPGCKQEMLKTDALATVNPAALRETERLREENLQLKKQLEYLQSQASSLQAQLGTAQTHIAHLEVARTTSFQPPAERAPVSPRPDLAPVPRPVVRSSTSPSAGTRRHAVRRGETMNSIARQYGLKLQQLMAANPSVEPKRLKAGQSLVIPSS